MEKEQNQRYLCKFCGNSFSTDRNLYKHKKTALYCLKNRGINNVKKHECKYCFRKYTTRQNLIKHLLKCKGIGDSEIEILNEKVEYLKNKNKEFKFENSKLMKKDNKRKEYKQQVQKLENENENLKNKISELREQLAEKKGEIAGIIKAPPRTISHTKTNKIQNTTNTTKNTYINPKLLLIKTDNIRPLTLKTIKEDIDDGKYTKDMFLRGIGGLTEFISNMITYENKDGIIERNYACTDSSRYRFHRLIESKEWKEDNGAHYVNNILDQVKDPARIYFTELVDKRRDAHNTEDNIDKEYYNGLIKDTRLVYKGSQKKNGKYRDALFRKVRGNVKGTAFV